MFNSLVKNLRGACFEERSVGAIYAYQSGTSENLALYYKNEAAIKNTEAANQWGYYQAKGEKEAAAKRA